MRMAKKLALWNSAHYLHMYKCSNHAATFAHTLFPNLVAPTKQPRLPLEPQAPRRPINSLIPRIILARHSKY
jgi:hypothetical protein